MPRVKHEDIRVQWEIDLFPEDIPVPADASPETRALHYAHHAERTYFKECGWTHTIAIDGRRYTVDCLTDQVTEET